MTLFEALKEAQKQAQNSLKYEYDPVILKKGDEIFKIWINQDGMISFADIQEIHRLDLMSVKWEVG